MTTYQKYADIYKNRANSKSKERSNEKHKISSNASYGAGTSEPSQYVLSRQELNEDRTSISPLRSKKGQTPSNYSRNSISPVRK